MNFPPVLVKKQTISSIEFSWTPIDSCDVYKIEKLNKNNTWMVVYWGGNTSCNVSGLEDGFCYKFRMNVLKHDGDKYIATNEPILFRGATLPDTPTTISLYRALIRSDEHIVRRYCMQKPHLIDVPGPKGMTPLYVATLRGDKSMVNILLSAGANVESGLPASQRTPLHVAMFMGYPDIGKILLLKRANREQRDCIGLNFGHYAVDGRHLDAIKFAINNKVNVEERDNCGWTMLQRAIVMEAGITVVKYLVERNCDIFVRDKNKLSCFDHARMSHQDDVLEFLDKHAKKKKKLNSADGGGIIIKPVEPTEPSIETGEKSELVIDLVDGV